MAWYFERNEEKGFAEETPAAGPDTQQLNTETYQQKAQVVC